MKKLLISPHQPASFTSSLHGSIFCAIYKIVCLVSLFTLNLLSGSAGAKRFGTRHVLVLYDFPSSTRTTDLERIFEKFGDHGDGKKGLKPHLVADYVQSVLCMIVRACNFDM